MRLENPVCVSNQWQLTGTRLAVNFGAGEKTTLVVMVSIYNSGANVFIIYHKPVSHRRTNVVTIDHTNTVDKYPPVLNPVKFSMQPDLGLV